MKGPLPSQVSHAIILWLKGGGLGTEVPQCIILSFNTVSCWNPGSIPISSWPLAGEKTSAAQFNSEFKNVTATFLVLLENGLLKK